MSEGVFHLGENTAGVVTITFQFLTKELSSNITTATKLEKAIAYSGEYVNPIAARTPQTQRNRPCYSRLVSTDVSEDHEEAEINRVLCLQSIRREFQVMT